MNLAAPTDGPTDRPDEPEVQMILEKIRIAIKEIRVLVRCCHPTEPDRIWEMSAGPAGERLLDPEYRAGYARGYADAVDALANCCEDVVAGIRTPDEMRAFITHCCNEVGDLLDQTVLPFDMEELSGNPH